MLDSSIPTKLFYQSIVILMKYIQAYVKTPAKKKKKNIWKVFKNGFLDQCKKGLFNKWYDKLMGFPGGSVTKDLAANTGDAGNARLIT